MTKTLFFWQIMCLYFSFAQLVLNQAEDRETRQIASTGQPQAWTMWKKRWWDPLSHRFVNWEITTITGIRMGQPNLKSKSF